MEPAWQQQKLETAEAVSIAVSEATMVIAATSEIMVASVTADSGTVAGDTAIRAMVTAGAATAGTVTMATTETMVTGIEVVEVGVGNHR